MKSALFFFVFLCIPKVGGSQIVQSSCIAQDSILAFYKTDADRLAVKNIFETNSAYKDSVIIHEELSTRILNALISVYNVTNIPERDEVIDSFDVHTYLNPSLTSFSVKADSNEVWMQNIKNGIAPTSNIIVDNLINIYSLTLDGYYTFGSTTAHRIRFKSDNNLNLKPLTLEFFNVPGVHNSTVSSYPGDGNDIEVSLHSGYVKLIYKHGYGDCMAGCLHSDFFIFKVYDDCSVEFISTSQLGLTDEKPFSSVSVFPNPATHLLQISNSNKESEYKILNLQGERVKNGVILNENSIDISELDSGIYFIKVDEQKSIKFIKK